MSCSAASRARAGCCDSDARRRLKHASSWRIAARSPFADDDGEGSRLVLSDALHRTAHRRDEPIAHVEQPNGATEWEYVTRVSIDERVRPGAVVLRDYDFQRPAFAMHGHARHDAHALDVRLERYHYAPGAFMIEHGVEGAARGGRHDARHGALLAARALEAERTESRVIAFETNAIDLRPGTVFSIEGHPRAELDPSRGLLATSLSIDGSPDGEWTIDAEAVPAKEPYRPAHRARTARRGSPARGRRARG